ncbi:MAG: flagellar export chaperone FliS [Eubacteriales bacterium]
MQQANVYMQYKEQSLETLTNGEIIIKLFEEASKQVNMAIYSITSGNIIKASNATTKAQKIIFALRNSLDMKYPISKEMDELYLFIYEQLRVANSNRDMTLFKDLLGMIDDFKISFRQANKLSRMGK